jgi:thiol-disulfide isomerase/thioredoxin
MGLKNKDLILYAAVGVCIILAIVIFTMWNKKDTPPPAVQKAVQQHQQQRVQAPAPNPDHETKLSEAQGPGQNGAGKPAIVMFYASWCGPSKAALPEWQKLEQALKGSPLQVISLEDAQYKKEIMENGVKGYPTIRLYPEGFPGPNPIEYNGPRTFEALMQFIKSGNQ